MTVVDGSAYDVLITQLTAYGMRLLLALLILGFGYALAGWLSRLVSRMCDRNRKIDVTLKPVLVKLTRLAVLIFTGVSVLKQFGFETTSLIAFIGAIGLTIGLALQGTLSNVAAGVMLLILRPFKPGHAVEISGKVYLMDEIGLFVTWAHLPDGPTVTLPNSAIWGNVITNYSVTHNGLRRINENYSISYDDDMGKAIALVKEILTTDLRMVPDPAPMVAIGKLGENSVDLIVHAWTRREDWFSTKHDLNKQIKEAFDQNGLTIPFPQRDVHLIQTP